MLYIVSLPIGNVGDITLRASEVLSRSDIILAEDTRRTGLLLKRLGIGKKHLLSFYEHNETGRISYVTQQLREGKEIALVSSAGTPLVSDPGYKLVRECLKEGLPVTACPGPSAAINALVLSGLAPDKFLFLGFLPRRRKKREKIIAQALKLPYTLIIFESPQRVRKTLEEIALKAGGERKFVLAREMTKIHEQFVRGELANASEMLGNNRIKGETVILIEKASKEVEG